MTAERVQSTLIIQLDDGSHRVSQWSYGISPLLAFSRCEEQARSRLHRIVSATLYVGDALPFHLPISFIGEPRHEQVQSA